MQPLAEQSAGQDIDVVMTAIGAQARAAARPLAVASTEQKNAALDAMADAVMAASDAILTANAADMTAGERNGLSAAMLDRLHMTPERIGAMANGMSLTMPPAAWMASQPSHTTMAKIANSPAARKKMRNPAVKTRIRICPLQERHPAPGV